MTLSEAQRRRVMRVLFVALGVLPCLALAAWAWVVRTDAYRAAWQRAISTELGLRVTIGAVRTPRPQAVLLEQVHAYDPETDAPVFVCRALEVEDFVDGRHLRASQPEVHAAHGARLFAALERRLRRETPSAETAVTFAAGELTWHVDGESLTLVRVEGLAGPAESAQQLLVNFALPETPAEHPASLRITRHTSTRPETTVELDSGAVVLPCRLLAPLADAAGVLGSRARFAGRFKLRQTPEGWNGIVAGDVMEADLDALVSRRFPHVLSGSAELRIHRAEATAGRLERAEFTLEAGPGQISRSLVDAIGVYLQTANPAAALPQANMLPFDRLALNGTIVGGGLTLQARPGATGGALLAAGDAVYWREPPPGAQPTANLLHALAPRADLQVPATAATAALVPWLSVVESGAAVATDAPAGALPAAVRLRLREATAPDETQRR